MDLRLMKCYPQVFWQNSKWTRSSFSSFNELFTHILLFSLRCSSCISDNSECVCIYCYSWIESIPRRNCFKNIILHICLCKSNKEAQWKWNPYLALLCYRGSACSINTCLKILSRGSVSPVADTVCSVQCQTPNRWLTPQYVQSTFLFLSLRYGMTTSCDGCRWSLTGSSSLEFHQTRSGDLILCSTTSECVNTITVIFFISFKHHYCKLRPMQNMNNDCQEQMPEWNNGAIGPQTHLIRCRVGRLGKCCNLYPSHCQHCLTPRLCSDLRAAPVIFL